MALAKHLSIFLVIAIGCLAAAQAANFTITNNCSYTVWAAAVPGGGIQLDPNDTWTLNVANGTMGGRIWGRTNCTFDRTGRGKCLTGDCKGLLNCTGFGSAPVTLVEYSLNQYNNLDFYDISLVDGFNVPLLFGPAANGSKTVQCSGDINGECPSQLKAPGGCNNPCTVFNTTQYCCNSGSGSCGPTTYSQFFKTRCPDAYSYPKDDAMSTFTSPGGSDYRLIFCPN